MPIAFPCSSCKALVTAPDAAGGRKARCRQCDAVVLIPSRHPAVGGMPQTSDLTAQNKIPGAGSTPTPPQRDPSAAHIVDSSRPSLHENNSRHPPRTKLVLAIGGVAFLLVFIATAFVLHAFGAHREQATRLPPANELPSEETDHRLAETKRTEKEQFEERERLTQLAAALTEREKALAHDRARDEAVFTVNERLQSLTKRVNDFLMADAKSRLDIGELDNRSLGLLAREGLTANEKDNRLVKDYLNSRDTLVSLSKRTNDIFLAELAVALNVKLPLHTPLENQKAFHLAGESLLQKAQIAALAPYEPQVNVVNEYALVARRIKADNARLNDDAARVLKQIEADRLAERQKQSERARVAGLDFAKTLSKDELRYANPGLARLVLIHSHYVKGELTADKAAELYNSWKKSNIPSVNSKIWEYTVLYAKICSDWIPWPEDKNSPPAPISESFEVFAKHIEKLATSGAIK